MKKKSAAKNKSKQPYEVPVIKKVRLTSSYRMAATQDAVSFSPSSGGF